MRWFLLFLIVVLAAWQLLPEPEPVPVEESFIAEPVRHLRNAEGLEDVQRAQTDARKERIEEAIDGG